MYSLIIIPLTEIRNEFNRAFPQIASQYVLSEECREPLYDWVIENALSYILKLKFDAEYYHIRHDVYRIVYETIGLSIEKYLLEKIDIGNITFEANKRVKSLVAGDNLIIAKDLKHAW